jgi:peptide deformylase
MALREIVLLGDPVLREKAREVEAFDEGLRTLVEDMFETMAYAEGAGLAAPQIGISRRILVADVRRDAGGDARVALVNPRVVESSPETERDHEGCLSIPGVTEAVTRPRRVVVEGFDPTGEPVRIEAEGLYARVLQHEVDHLDGVLFIDHLDPMARDRIKRRIRKEGFTEDAAGHRAAAL